MKLLKGLSIVCVLLTVNASAAGFDPRQIPLEIQSWWFPAFGHIHAAAALPVRQTVSGKFTLNVRIVLHNNPSHLYLVYTSSDEDVKFKKNVSLDCPYDGKTESTCAWNVPIAIDTTLMSDGWREFKLHANSITPDGKVFRVSSEMPIYVNNGKPDKDYTGGVVQEQRLRTLAYYGGLPVPGAHIRDIPIAPIRGIYTFQVKAASAESSHLTVALDQNHYIPAAPPWVEQPATNGPTLFDRDGDFRKDYVPITIDTRKLANGWHTLAAKSIGVTGDTSSCSYCDPKVISKSHAVAKIWFYVKN